MFLIDTPFKIDSLLELISANIVEKTPIIIKSIRITIITIALLFLPFLGCFLCLNEYVCSLFFCSFVVSFCSVFVLFSTRSCFVSFTSSLTSLG